MAVDATQLVADAQCIESCIPVGLLQAAQLAQMVQPSIVNVSQVQQVTNTNVLLLAANPKRRRALISTAPASANDVLVGPSDMTATTGFLVPRFNANVANSVLEVFTQGELYVRGTTGQVMSVIEFLVP